MVDPTSILKDWGLTLGLLAVVACIASVLLMISLREFSFWFFRINKVLKNQEIILAKLEALQVPAENSSPKASPLEALSLEALPLRPSLEASDGTSIPFKKKEKAEFQLLN